jgi:hypothetical protein
MINKGICICTSGRVVIRRLSARSGDGTLRFCYGDHLLDLLPCGSMLISSLVMLGIFWHAVRTLPGFLESAGYVFGILLASFMLDACFPRHVD